MKPWRMACAILFGVVLTAGAGATAQRLNLVALNTVERGEWSLKTPEGQTRKLCLTNPASLTQIQHGANLCDHVVLDNTPRSATVRYTCSGHGQGRTTIRVETNRLLQIDTQGVRDGVPFADEYEARLVGRCRPGA